MTLTSELLRAHDRMELSTLKALLYIAQKGEVRVSELGNHFGWTSAKCTYQAQLLCNGHNTGQKEIPALKLCRLDLDPADSRARLISLTPLGRQLLSNLSEILETGYDSSKRNKVAS